MKDENGKVIKMVINGSKVMSTTGEDHPKEMTLFEGKYMLIVKDGCKAHIVINKIDPIIERETDGKNV